MPLALAGRNSSARKIIVPGSGTFNRVAIEGPQAAGFLSFNPLIPGLLLHAG